MPDITLIDLSKFRFEKANEMLVSAKRDLSACDYASANNRAYYCIFHAMRSVLALDGEDYKKHSAVIARFALNYLKTETLPREYGKLIANASLIRGRRIMRTSIFALLTIRKDSSPARRIFLIASTNI